MANVTVSSVDVTIATETFGGAALPSWKMLGVFQEADASAWDVSFAGFNSTSFKDWNTTTLTEGADYSSYLETGHMVMSAPQQDKQAVIVNAFLSKTSKTQTPGGFYEAPTRSSNLYSGSLSVLGGVATEKHRTATYEDNLYVFNLNDVSGALSRYNVATDSWTSLTSSGGGESHFSLGVYSNYAYLVGGVSGTSSVKTVRRYDFSADTWSTLPNFPGTAVHSAGYTQKDGILHIVGGDTQLASTSKEYWQFDMSTETWTQFGSFFDKGRKGGGLFFLGSSLYFWGGVTFSPVAFEDDLYLYTGGSPAWSLVSQAGSIPSGRRDFGYATNNNKFYIHGGSQTSSDSLSDIHVYDGTWSQVSASVGVDVDEGSLTALNNRLYIVGGEKENNAPSDQLLRYVI